MKQQENYYMESKFKYLDEMSSLDFFVLRIFYLFLNLYMVWFHPTFLNMRNYITLPVHFC